ncbi:MAG TPA: ABC transporter permease [Chloroflexota bacterium]|nr:ABC transporter permease [Chloroflexota bacterium]
MTPLQPLLRKEFRQIIRSRRTVLAAAAIPLLMLTFVTGGDILTLKLGFGHHPIYLLSSARSISASTLLRHETLPVLVTISGMVTPSIIMGDALLGERERRTLELLVALPVTVADVVLAKVLAVVTFAAAVTIPLFAVNVLMVSAAGDASPTQDLALFILLLAAISYAVASSLLVATLAGEPRAANIISGLVLGPVVPFEGLILVGIPGLISVGICSAALALAASVALLWSLRLLSFERLFGAA